MLSERILTPTTIEQDINPNEENTSLSPFRDLLSPIPHDNTSISYIEDY